MKYTTQPSESFDAEILRQELVAALGETGWSLNTAGNTVEFVGEFDPEATILAHFANGTAREAAKQAETEQKVADAAAKTIAKGDTVIQYLRDHTPEEVEAYVQTNVTDLASARTMMKKFAVALCVLAKQEFRE